MGSPISQVASSTQPQGKGASQPPNFAQPAGPQQQIDSPVTGLNNQPSNGQSFNQTIGKGGAKSVQPTTTNSATSGQPQLGRANNYSNTVGQWDNASIQPRQTQSGKGKGY